jgi:taurine dioxygenase
VEIVGTLVPFGVEMRLDLRRQLDEASRAQLREMLAANQLLLLRGQDLSFEEQRQVLESFGPVLVDDPHQLGFTYVTNVGPAAAGGSEEITYHYDLAYCPEPFKIISLHAKDVQDHKTVTRYVSGIRAYDQIEAGLRVRVGDRVARHVYPGLGHRSIEASRRPFDPELPHTGRPVIASHPANGRPVLLVSQFSTNSILGMDTDESTEVLDLLYETLYAEDNTYVHSWRRGDLVIWDNLALQHARGDVPEQRVGRRILQKVVVADRGQAAQFPEFDRWRLAEDVIPA